MKREDDQFIILVVIVSSDEPCIIEVFKAHVHNGKMEEKNYLSLLLQFLDLLFSSNNSS